MAEYSLGTARGTIEIDYKGTGAEQASESIKQTSKAAASGDESLRKLGTGALVAGAGIVAGLGVAVKSAASFEKGLSGIQAVSGATAGEMEAVRKKALQLGADTAFSAGDAALAVEELVKAGLSVPDVLNGAADATVSLAAAGGVALPEAAAIAANAMNQFGLAAEDMPNIADKIAGAANASAIDVSDFGMSMSQAGAVAKLAGLSFDDTALAITAMGNAGIKGSDAGTSLKTFLQNLQPQTKKQIGLMKELGLMTKEGGNQFFDATGKIRPMSEIAGVLSKSLKGMSDAQKTATLETLFGSDAIRAAAVIASEGAGGMNELSASINKVKAADVAATRMKNLDGQLEQLKGSAETLAIGLGTVLIPVLTNIAAKGTELVNWFSSLDSGTQKAIVLVAAFAGGLLLFVGTLIKAVQFVQAARVAMIALNGTFLVNPIFLIIVAIIALVAAIILLWKNSETFRRIVTAAWEGVKSAAMAVATWFTGTLVPWFQKVWATISAGAQQLWGWMKTIWGGIAAVVTLYIRTVLAVVSAVLRAVLGIWRAYWSLFGPLIKAVWNVIRAIISLALAWIKVAVKAALSVVKAVWTSIWNGIKSVTSSVLNAIKAVFSSVLSAIQSVVNAVWGRIGGTVTGALNKIKSVVSSALGAVKSTVISIFGSLTNVISSNMGNARSAVSGAVDGIKGIFSGAGSWLYDAGARLIQGLVNGIRSMIGAISGALNDVAGKIRSFMPGSPIKEGPLKDHGWNQGRPGKQLVQLIAGGIEDDIDLISRAFEGLSPELPSTLTSGGVAASASEARTGTSRNVSEGFSTSPLFGEGAIQVHAPQNMSAEQVGAAVASKVAFGVSTGSVPVSPPVRSR